ncbi:putative dipeptidyl-aminopeptidase B [Fulvia fulva]|uniref:dipeptidyl-peptidase IV n=1 Tax=Passalora fulva TaxID=5499 RepID=A0A9Q8L5G7_PASFU|nr:putative dipeptidyl-aminopeptidase B [Fulvia fulva]KAK4635433.1 putative dipeptidyl-aminopeptidase B [Fulvia fulva]KAK4636994.1 putative dipeptidyl-aminopeptidase B [Fulvia fulva]UJO11226.1 putative dipeptidyl-aminopeptidase B [Fulvia fulva]WPV09085.1 putative dipeptidyl-aminopeptidase B [Fulvia fulva]WPV24212.1 putative dipeptidyl-aminopeptidase B [Fulvia fulva]
MARSDMDESQPLTTSGEARASHEEMGRPSASSASTTSFVLEHASDTAATRAKEALYSDGPHEGTEEMDVEEHMAWQRPVKPADRAFRRVLYILIAVGLVGWVAALFLFLGQDRHIPHSSRPHDPHATSTTGNGKKITLEQVLHGEWSPTRHSLNWVAGPDGEDGLLLERGSIGRDYLVVEDVRYRGQDLSVQRQHSTTLMKTGFFVVNGMSVSVDEAWPSPDHKHVLVQSSYQSNWRHSNTGLYWIFDVATQTGQPLDPVKPDERVQLATWSPDSKTVVFTRNNNMFIRHLDRTAADPITSDGGKDLFYGIPDWVYEEEVLAEGAATWWSGDGKFVAFFRTDESSVPTFPVQYFFRSPTGKKKKAGEENYPDVRHIKYPKAGAPMSVVSLMFYDVGRAEVFTVPVSNDFADNDRLITEVVWAGETGKVLIRSTNRESDVLKMILVDAVERTGKTVRERDVQKLDGGWAEISHTTTFVPADSSNGRLHDGYIDTIVHENFDHLAYFTPLDNPEPKMLTSGDWEVVQGPSAVDTIQNVVYFIGTKHGSTQRHLYTCTLKDGPNSVKHVTNVDEIGYYSASFSTLTQFMLLSYQGPGIPWQKVQATPTNKGGLQEFTIEDNKALGELAKRTELPVEIYSTINVDGFDLNIVERRPPHFNEKKKYPVLFQLYNGPGFQNVDRKFSVDFQSYVASNLGYIVVTLDGLGTGYKGRKQRTIVRDNIGYWEAYSQIEAAKIWKAKKYVDEERMAIWGWSYGGFMALKTIETDAGNTFKYGMAVAPVTDWRYYDSIYTERYMHTPQNNPEGYENATITNITGLAANVRFLVMHGVSDDNVHFQNTLSLLDRLDMANVRNYDVHVFPDSDHSIYFHNANSIVYGKLRDWLVNAFNGEWLRVVDPSPLRAYEGLP